MMTMKDDIDDNRLSDLWYLMMIINVDLWYDNVDDDDDRWWW